MAQRVGFVGLGRMGSRMARRLLDHGYEVVVHDVNPDALRPFQERGVPTASSPQQLAGDVPIVLASLPTPASVESVVLGPDGLADGFAAGGVFVDVSTTGLVVEERIANALAQRGIEILDAPVSGGVRGAEEGTLSVMVAGKRELFDRYQPILEVIGHHVFHVAERPGLGQAMKLVNNLLSATALAASSEALVLATKAGLDPKVVVDILNVSSGRNSATLEKLPRSVLPGTFDFGFVLELMCKDVHLAGAMATHHDVPLLVGRSVEQVWDLARLQGLAKEDLTAIIKLWERMAGVEVRSDPTSPGTPA